MGAQSITLTGNLTGPPELRVGPSGTPMVRLTVACQDRYRDKTGEFKDGDTLFQRAVCFGPMAENIAASCNRGTRVVLTGALRQSSYEHKDPETGEVSTRWSTDFVVDEAAVSMRWAEVRVNRAERRQAAEPAADEPWAAPADEPAALAAVSA